MAWKEAGTEEGREKEGGRKQNARFVKVVYCPFPHLFISLFSFPSSLPAYIPSSSLDPRHLGRARARPPRSWTSLLRRVAHGEKRKRSWRKKGDDGAERSRLPFSLLFSLLFAVAFIVVEGGSTTERRRVGWRKRGARALLV